MSLSRRTLLKAGAASGALLLAGGRGALAAPLGPTGEFDTSRASSLFPGTRLVHVDWHNHTLYSDGDGDPARAFASMRDAGLDGAALTDHATVGKALGPLELACPRELCQGLEGLDEAKWAQTRELADTSNVDGRFTAVRGFEWSSPTLGHMNVWFSDTWIDPASTGGVSSGEGLAQFLHEAPGLGPVLAGPLDDAVRALPTSGPTMRPFYDWLSADPSRAVLGGGRDAIAGFNHPGRETGRFGYFAYDPALRDRVVSMEIFNRGEDYLYEGVDAGSVSPLTDCLDKGWRVGLLGVTDEHGTDWGYPDGKGRTGLYVRSLTRAGLREAMEARRFFSTRLRGFRVGATANGVPMGSVLRHRSGRVRFRLDVDRGTAGRGTPLSVQVLMTGTPLPKVVHEQRFELGRGVVDLDVPVDVEDGRWVVLRVSDPAAPADARAPEAFRAYGSAIAYPSPFFLDPEGVAAPTTTATAVPRPDTVPSGSLAATGAPAVAGAAALATVAGLAASRALRR